MTTLTAASRQWASRPADERFLDLHDLLARVGGERDRSRERIVSSRSVRVEPHPADETWGVALTAGDDLAHATHWSFGQIASLAGAPAGYLRTLPAPLVSDCLGFGLNVKRGAQDVGLLATDTDQGVALRAATGPAYGRVWNSDVVSALIDRVGDGRTGDFRVPGEFGQAVEVTKDNTTIYGSDRDIFVFLADEEHRIEVGNRRDGKPGSLARGFFVWNSEVGSQTLGAAFFLFDYVCCNRIVWGAQQFKEIRLRHTKSAPDRWLDEVQPILLEYGRSAAAPVEATIKAAQEAKIEVDLQRFLKGRFSSASVIDQIAQAHVREEGRPIETVWDAVTGATAYAKTLPHQDERVGVEREAGKLLDLVKV